jgi:hypothetical protein
MYLRELFIKNSGPIRDLNIELTFDENGRPFPHIIVGRNGAGKTNLLSVIADALIRAASSFFTDIVTPYGGMGQSFFRIVGGRALTYNQPGGFSILKFTDGSDEFFYAENTGSFSREDAVALIPASLEPGARWDPNGQGKNFNIPKEKVHTIFQGGVYMYSPSSRFEYPNWLNRDALIEDTYDLSDRFSTTLGKPIYVEHGIDKFAQWLLGLITDSRMPVSLTADANDPTKFVASAAGPYDARPLQTLEIANSILRIIMNDSEAQFYWGGRQDTRKIGVASGNQPLAAGLDSLSGGQVSLLSIFGTVLRYADPGLLGPALTPDSIHGLIIIDELDAHMHIDLQMEALPKLIALFPNIQFIISCQSPFFVFGMEKRLTHDGVRIIDLPTGLAVDAETYSEFGRAMDALTDSKAFEMKLGEFLAATERPLVWVGGETDLIYFQTAAKLLGFPQLVALFDWVGADNESGKAMQTGDSGLNSAYKFLKANPDFTTRPVVLVYDSDANKPSDTFGSVAVLSLVKVDGAHCNKGVENLLPTHVFTDGMYQTVEEPGDYGKPTIIQKLRKMQLCQSLCDENASAANFENFKPTLELVSAALVGLGWENSTDNDDASATVDGTADSSPEQS